MKRLNLRKPVKLVPGDTIAVIAPSSALGVYFRHRVDRGIAALQAIGFKVLEYPSVTKCIGGQAGTAEERAEDIHAAFKDPKVKAILCVIGGLSANSVLPHLDFELIRNNPKIFCGYSDCGVLHYAFLTKASLVTYYGPCIMTQFGEYPSPLKYTLDSFMKVLCEAKAPGRVSPSEEWTDELLDWSTKTDLTRPRQMRNNEGHTWLREGCAKGQIFGGALYTVHQMRGTPYDIDMSDAILFIEIPEGMDPSSGFPLSFVDSELMDLRNSGILSSISGLVVGRTIGYSADENKKFVEIVRSHVNGFAYPVLMNVNIGHADPILTVPLGTACRLDSSLDLFSFEESGVV